jgi:hypothetical protein
MKNFLFLALVLFVQIASAQLENLPKVYQSLINSEQLFNDRVENTNVFASIMQNDVDPKYLPEKQPVFKLDKVLVPVSDLTIVDTSDGKFTKMMTVRVKGKEYIPLFIHPESKELYQMELDTLSPTKEYYATPLSSHRSMVIWDETIPEKPLYVKLSLNKKIGEDLRILTSGQIERAAAISYLLKTMDLKALQKKGIYFIDEPFHMYIKRNNTGYSVRAMPSFPEGSELMPMFTLYSKKGGQPRLVKMIEESGLPAKTVVREQLMNPLLSHMSELFFEHGFVGDLHEQNVAIRLQDGKFTGEIYYRDLAGFDINQEMRFAAGKDMSFLPKDFPTKHLHFHRADLINKALDYLLNSNFYAMRMALKNYYPEVTKEWVEAQVLNHLSAQVFLRTGTRANDFATLKTAITKHLNTRAKRMCNKTLIDLLSFNFIQLPSRRLSHPQSKQFFSLGGSRPGLTRISDSANVGF